MLVSLLRLLAAYLSWCSIRKLRCLSIGIFLVVCLFHVGNVGSLRLGRFVASRLAYGLGVCFVRFASYSIVVGRNKGHLFGYCILSYYACCFSEFARF